MAVTSNRYMIDSADPSTFMLGADDSPSGEAVMAPVLDQSVDEAAALLRAPKGLPRKQRFREGVLRASAAGRRALVALGWPAIRDSDWQGADGQVAFDGDLGPRRFPVIPGGLETGGAIDTNAAGRDDTTRRSMFKLKRSRRAVWRFGGHVLVETMKRR